MQRVTRNLGSGWHARGDYNQEACPFQRLDGGSFQREKPGRPDPLRQVSSPLSAVSPRQRRRAEDRGGARKDVTAQDHAWEGHGMGHETKDVTLEGMLASLLIFLIHGISSNSC